ncbi:hypothetical protein [Parenemella sanctibonifatiensis]|uniref:Carboxypeptidase regulatory-like domain-containing protein n=1 Tax=Parenemella sanctibonifatiensis TaxID=2016505 RepID=A0A255EN10_9ACTN|nr:hypothetical protein [Parenemella sanctibonifatiensis]OYN89503.1 hypothetical protein CGZ91_11495 [Parenemella sanctibonifatiensis]
MLALLLVLLTAPLAYAQTGTTLTLVTEPNPVQPGSQATLRGTLTGQDGKPVGSAPIQLIVNGAPLSQTTTAADGSYRLIVQAREDRENATYAVEVRFPGTGTYLATSTSGQIQVSSAGAEAPPAEPAPTPAPPVGQPTAVTLVVPQPRIRAADLFEVSGQLMAGPDPVSGAVIEVHLNADPVATAVTDDNGNWTAFVRTTAMEVTDNPVEMDLYARYRGEDGLNASEAHAVVGVDPPPAPPSITTPSAGPTRVASSDPATAPTRSARPQLQTQETSPDRLGRTLAAVGLGSLVVLGLLVSLAMMAHRRGR